MPCTMPTVSGAQQKLKSAITTIQSLGFRLIEWQDRAHCGHGDCSIAAVQEISTQPSKSPINRYCLTSVGLRGPMGTGDFAPLGEAHPPSIRTNTGHPRPAVLVASRRMVLYSGVSMP